VVIPIHQNNFIKKYPKFHTQRLDGTDWKLIGRS
jgi:hypothetical protein